MRLFVSIPAHILVNQEDNKAQGLSYSVLRTTLSFCWDLQGFEQKIFCLIENRMLYEDSSIGSGLFYKKEINHVKLFLSGLEKSN